MAVHQSHMLTKSLQDAILRLCTQHLNFKSTLEIDGIICISPGESTSDIVIKMHRTVLKPNDSNISTLHGNAPIVSQNTSNTCGKPCMTLTNQESEVSSITHGSIGSQKHNTDNSTTAPVEAYQPEIRSDDTTLYYESSDAIEDQRKQMKSHSTSSKHRRSINPDVSEPMEKFIKLEVDDADEDGNDIVDEEAGAFREGHDPSTISSRGQENTGESRTSGGMDQFEPGKHTIRGTNHSEQDTKLQSQKSPQQPSKRNLFYVSGRKKERKYSCELCLKKFYAMYDLTKHKRTHTGEKPFQCKYCDRAFSDKSNYWKHMNKLHPHESETKVPQGLDLK